MTSAMPRGGVEYLCHWPSRQGMPGRDLWDCEMRRGSWIQQHKFKRVNGGDGVLQQP